MKDLKDVVGLKAARSILSRRGIDISKADVRMMHGVLHIRGQIGTVRGGNAPAGDLKTEMELVARVLKQKPDIRDVVLECSYSGG